MPVHSRHLSCQANTSRASTTSCVHSCLPCPQAFMCGQQRVDHPARLHPPTYLCHVHVYGRQLVKYRQQLLHKSWRQAAQRIRHILQAGPRARANKAMSAQCSKTQVAETGFYSSPTPRGSENCTLWVWLQSLCAWRSTATAVQHTHKTAHKVPTALPHTADYQSGDPVMFICNVHTCTHECIIIACTSTDTVPAVPEG